MPWDVADDLPRSPLYGSELLDRGFDVAIDTLGFIWFGNFGGGESKYWPVEGSVSL
jgi:hypothetical protein